MFVSVSKSLGVARRLEGSVRDGVRHPKRIGFLSFGAWRGWLKVENRDYWRYELDREGPFRALIAKPAPR